MARSNPNWLWDPKLQKVVNVIAKVWWHNNGDAILEWLESEGIDSWNVHYPDSNKSPVIFLYTDEQISYFNLRWPQ